MRWANAIAVGNVAIRERTPMAGGWQTRILLGPDHWRNREKMRQGYLAMADLNLALAQEALPVDGEAWELSARWEGK